MSSVAHFLFFSIQSAKLVCIQTKLNVGLPVWIGPTEGIHILGIALVSSCVEMDPLESSRVHHHFFSILNYSSAPFRELWTANND